MIISKLKTNNISKINNFFSTYLLFYTIKKLYPNIKYCNENIINNEFNYEFYSKNNIIKKKHFNNIEKHFLFLLKKNNKIKKLHINKKTTIKLFFHQKYILKIIKKNNNIYKLKNFIHLFKNNNIKINKTKAIFKILKISGIYWNNNSKNEMLQQVNGIIYNKQNLLLKYLNKFEKYKKRDHRKIGKTQNLFHIDEESPGMIFWHNKGLTIYKNIISFISKILNNNNYLEIKTPSLLQKILWEKSGHWSKFKQNIITSNINKKIFILKPMNCPAHIQIFKKKNISYKSLPLRFNEFGSCYRNEQKGSLHGLMRTRNFIQDDAHIFCTINQAKDEIKNFINILLKIYKSFNFKKIKINISTKPKKSIGLKKTWDISEKILINSLEELGIKYNIAPEDGAFYGPKIEFALKDSLNRIWQCGTIQIDFYMAKKLNAFYISKDNKKEYPIILHHAILGSIERFIGILLEETNGCLPFWINPIHINIISINKQNIDYVNTIYEKIKKYNFKIEKDIRNINLELKIRESIIQKIPYIIIIGQNEIQNNTITIRNNKGEIKKNIKLNDFIKKIKKEYKNIFKLF